MSQAPDTLTLGEILGRAFRIEWHEAVAVARALVAVVQPINLSKSGFAALDEITLSSAGVVSAHGHSFKSDAGRWIASVLQTILAKSEPPVQLRLLAVQAAAEGIDVAHLDGSLAYFERPNREVVLQGLYARAAAAAPDMLGPAPVLQVPTAPASKDQPAKRAASKGQLGKALKVAMMAIVCVAVAAAATWVAYTQRQRLPAADSAMMTKAADAIGDAMLAGASKVTDAAGLGRLVPPDAPPSPPPASSVTAGDIALPRSARRTAVAAAAAEAAVAEITAFDLTGAGVVAASAPPPQSSPDTTSFVAELAGEDAPVYAEGAAGVAPPVGIRPQLARELPSTVHPEDLTPLELVIDTDGSIESARLMAPPKNVIDSMIVSVAKAWEFEPALKDGRPVKYRKTVWIRTR
jgi:hypothetical protein